MGGNVIETRSVLNGLSPAPQQMHVAHDVIDADDSEEIFVGSSAPPLPSNATYQNGLPQPPMPQLDRYENFSNYTVVGGQNRTRGGNARAPPLVSCVNSPRFSQRSVLIN